MKQLKVSRVAGESVQNGTTLENWQFLKSLNIQRMLCNTAIQFLVYFIQEKSK